MYDGVVDAELDVLSLAFGSNLEIGGFFQEVILFDLLTWISPLLQLLATPRW